MERKNVSKRTRGDGSQIKIKYRKDGTVKKIVSRGADKQLNSTTGKTKYNKDGTVKKKFVNMNISSTSKNKKVKQSKYREGGASESNYSYQDFLDL